MNTRSAMLVHRFYGNIRSKSRDDKLIITPLGVGMASTSSNAHAFGDNGIWEWACSEEPGLRSEEGGKKNPVQGNHSAI